jgi:hypothetical protein
MRNRPLDPVQRQLVEEIARVQAEPCDFCHSRRWRAPYEVEVSTGEWNFVVTCANCPAAPALCPYRGRRQQAA